MTNNDISPRRGKALAGLFVVGVGAVLLMQKLGVYFPAWLFTWPVLLIVLGFYVGIKHQFRHFGWIIPTLIGSVFLIDEIYKNSQLSNYMWPVVVIMIGLALIFGRHKRHHPPYAHRRWHEKMEEWKGEWERKWEEQHRNPDANCQPFQPDWAKAPRDNADATNNPDDFIDTTSVFAGIKKIVLSKNFRGGDIVTFLGGAELNLSQADINGRVVLEVTQVMGGTRIIVPPHWQVQSEMVAVFGGIEDKRPPQSLSTNPDKILIIKGTSIFGGIDISSY